MNSTSARLKTWLYWWGPPIAVMLVMFFTSGTPGNRLPHFKGLFEFVVKKSGHALGYAMLALAFHRALTKGAAPQPRASLASWGLAVLYAATDEYHQRFTSGRGSSGLDIVIDGFGAATALLIAHALAWVKRKTVGATSDG